QGGKATYRNRYVRTRAFELEEAAGKALWPGIMMPVQLDNPHGPHKNTANTDLVFHAGKLLSLWWLGQEPYEVRPEDLSTVGPYDFAGRLGCGVAAHPKVDMQTGEMVFMDYSVLKPPYITYGLVDAEGRLVRTVPIDLPGPRLLHDIAITEHYTIFLDFPMTWDRAALMKGRRRVLFDRSLPARFGILPRHAERDETRWFETSPCYMYHTINAYEDGDEIVLTGCRIDNPLPDAPAGPEVATLEILQLVPYFWRWRFNLKTGAVKEEQLDDAPSEFPRMNNRLLGRRTRYSYNPRVAPKSTLLFDAVIKYDADAGRASTYEYGNEVYGGEVVFAPDPKGTAEDDGWLVTFTYDAREDASEFLVLDAREPERGPVARVPIPQRVPIGFHAWWVEGARLG
ncbi:MAG: carotenoid oxygenase family protein, partial [Candidatus Methylomirabilis sp.]|nr:carotenoid oxygenase family protein [Deltaproteobacteria bacterium]